MAAPRSAGNGTGRSRAVRRGQWRTRLIGRCRWRWSTAWVSSVRVTVASGNLHHSRRAGICRRKRRQLGVVEDEQFRRGDFDFAGRHFGIDSVSAAQANLAYRGDDVLRTDMLGLGVALGGQFLVEDNLRDAVAVAQVKEDEVAVVAAAIDPAHEGHDLAGVRGAELAAGVGALAGS